MGWVIQKLESGNWTYAGIDFCFPRPHKKYADKTLIKLKEHFKDREFRIIEDKEIYPNWE